MQLTLTSGFKLLTSKESPTVFETVENRQFMKGVKLVVGKNDNLCPVIALLSYLAVRGDSPGALFRWENLTPLSKTKL